MNWTFFSVIFDPFCYSGEYFQNTVSFAVNKEQGYKKNKKKNNNKKTKQSKTKQKTKQTKQRNRKTKNQIEHE